MPLSFPSKRRKKIHTRKIMCTVYEREDGLWDVEGHMVDKKTYAFPNRDRGGEIKAGEPVHDMWLRLTLAATLEIKDIEVVTDSAPFSICTEAINHYKSLVGLKIKSGWSRQIQERVGGVQGCIHHTDLLKSIATTAVQGITEILKRTSSDNTSEPTINRSLVNRCATFSQTSSVVKRLYPMLYRTNKVE